MRLKASAFLFVLALIGSYNSSFAQGASKFSGLEIGGGLMMTRYDLDGNYESYTYNAIHDNKTTAGMKSAGGKTIMAGFTFPVAKFGEGAGFALTANLMYTGGGTKDSMRLSGKNVLTEYKTTSIGLPISADFKAGADAVFSNAYNVTGCVGFGVFPNRTSYTLGSFKGNKYSFDPFVKAEFGWRLGMVMKLRAMYVFRTNSFTYKDAEDAGSSEAPSNLKLNYNGTINHDPEFNVCLILMPMSFGWSK